MLNPNIVLNQKQAPSVTASNHNSPSNILSILRFIRLLLYHICDKVKSEMIDIDDILEIFDAKYVLDILLHGVS